MTNLNLILFIRVGVLLFKLIQGPHDVDLGEVEADGNIDIRDGRLTTRDILHHVIFTVSSGEFIRPTRPTRSISFML